MSTIACVASVSGSKVHSTPPSTPAAGSILTLRNVNSNLCVSTGGSTSFTDLVQAACSTSNQQQFTLKTSPVNGWYYLDSGASTLCWDIVNGSSSAGALLQQYTCTAVSPEYFQLKAVSGGYEILSRSLTNGCVDVVSSSTAAGAHLEQNTCTGAANQIFSVSVVNGSVAQLTATPSSASFGNVVTGTQNSQTIKITNNGATSVSISQDNLSGAGFSVTGITLPLAIAAGQSATFNAVFAPATTGTVDGSISLVSNASNSPLGITLSGTGVSPTHLLAANPTTLSFGNASLGTVHSLSTTVTNTGNSNVTISSVTTSGAGLSVSGLSSNTTLSPNQSSTLAVSFSPTLAGSVSGSITVASNATNSPTTIGLSGTGVTGPSVSISSPANGATVSGTITVSGAASAAAGIGSVQVQVDSGTFSAASGTSSWTLGLNTSTLANASHTITARATDALGNTGSTSISINVSNSSSGPTVNVQSFGATGDGSTNDTSAINSAIAALTSGATLYFPCGTYLISSGLTSIALNNVTLAGQAGCSSGIVTIKGTGSGSTLLQVGSGESLSSPAAITATTADLDPTFQANFSAIGAGVGDYVLLTESVSSTDTSHSNCGGSGCRGEVLKITALNGNTATVETAVHQVYDINDVPWVQKVLNPVSGVTVKDLRIDGSGAAMYALAVVNAVDLNANNLTLQNVSCSAIAAVNGYNDAYSSITITHAGANNGCNIGGSAVSLQQQGNLNVDGVSISQMNPGGFGFIPFREANGTFSNISVDGTGTGSGRLFKTNSASHNVFNSISTNRDEGAYYQGITIEYFSHHNVWNNCKVTNNVIVSGSGNNSGITLYGDVANGNHQGSNHYNTFNNCTVTGNDGFALWVNDNNNHIEISGGTWSSVPGNYVIAFDDSSPCCTTNAYIHDATITGPGTTGIFIENGSPNACINDNTFSGLSTAIEVTASSDLGSGNILNGLPSNLTLGTCP